MSSPFTYSPFRAWYTVNLVVQQIPVKETFDRQCASCHGEKGQGDGRAARMLKPRPSDFQDPEGVSALSDDELVEVITAGRASMPAFGRVLREEVITALSAYVRDLSRSVEP